MSLEDLRIFCLSPQDLGIISRFVREVRGAIGEDWLSNLVARARSWHPVRNVNDNHEEHYFNRTAGVSYNIGSLHLSQASALDFRLYNRHPAFPLNGLTKRVSTLR